MCENHNLILKTTPTKDLSPISISDSFKFEIKVCNNCKIEKSVKEFSKNSNRKDGLFINCKECSNSYKNNYRKTLNGALRTLLSNSKNDSKKRLYKGRIDAGVFNITFEDLEELWLKQDKKCYYSNIQMNYDKKEWKVSLERLDPTKGYEKENIVLCCQEFNGSSQWSKNKIQEMIKILNEDIIKHIVSFDLEIKERKKSTKIVKSIIDDIEYYNCSYCGEIKSIDEFYTRIGSGCKKCNLIRKKEYNSSPRGLINQLIQNAKSSIKTRLKKRENSFDIDFDYLIELYNKQNGLCAYSGLPLKFGNYLDKNWTCSLERINIKKGYTKDNICLICYEFNTGDKTILYKYDDEENCGWSKDKFKFFLDNLVSI